MSSNSHLLSRDHRRGDADTFCTLVRDHEGMVFATAKRVTGDAALAEDVAQETFLELARKDHGAVESVAAWLHRVAWRKACNAVRGEARRQRHEKAAAETLPVAEEVPWKDLEPLIDEVLEELPARMRESLVEHYLEGRTQQELASRTGVSQSTVSRQLDAGINELRSRLRAKGVLCGVGLAALLSARTAKAAPASLNASLGKLAISGVGTGASSTQAAVVTTTLLTMNFTKVALTTLLVAALIGPPLAFLYKASSTSKPRAVALPAKATALPVPQTAKAAAAAPRYYRPAPVPEDVRLKVDAIIRRHQGLSKEQVAQSEELGPLFVSFKAELNSPEMRRRMDEVVKAMQAVKGFEHGTVGMDFGEPDSPEFRAWLEAVLSGDRQRAQDWYLNRLEGAVFEFALDPSLKRTSDGVSVDPLLPAKP